MLLSIILINGKCCSLHIERAYIYKSKNQIIIKRKDDISCYLMFYCHTSFYDINDIKSFEVKYNSKREYEFIVIDYNNNEDIIIAIKDINKKDRDIIINFLNSLIDN